MNLWNDRQKLEQFHHFLDNLVLPNFHCKGGGLSSFNRAKEPISNLILFPYHLSSCCNEVFQNCCFTCWIFCNTIAAPLEMLPRHRLYKSTDMTSTASLLTRVCWWAVDILLAWDVPPPAPTTNNIRSPTLCDSTSVQFDIMLQAYASHIYLMRGWGSVPDLAARWRLLEKHIFIFQSSWPGFEPGAS